MWNGWPEISDNGAESIKILYINCEHNKALKGHHCGITDSWIKSIRNNISWNICGITQKRLFLMTH